MKYLLLLLLISPFTIALDLSIPEENVDWSDPNEALSKIGALLGEAMPSIALMIDQRLSQGIKTNFFNQEALTTTIPAQFVKKFNCKIVPIYIERINKFNFALKVYEPISYSKDETIHNITSDLNKILEKMILKNPEQWIWSHNRWKV